MTDSLDIQTLKQEYDSGRLDPAAVLADVLKRIERYPDPAIWIDRFPADLVEKQLAGALERRRAGLAQPLLGIPFAIKDNIDFAGRPTTAACPQFSYVAEQSAAAVKRLCDAGAIAVGKANLDQFATGLVGTRSPYGACRNPFNPEYISGGSSSGSAVAVAAGLVSFAIGTDTAGSGRVPAALNNIVGLKPTRGLVSARGVVPACRSLDCVSILSLSCADARTIFQCINGFDPGDPHSRSRAELPSHRPIPREGFKFGVPREEGLRFFDDGQAKAAYVATVARLQSIGGQKVEIDYAPFAKAAALLYAGPWVAERFLVARDLLKRAPEALLPVTAAILSRGQSITAADAFAAMYEVQSLRQSARAIWEQMDLLLLPTTGAAYTIAQVEADPIQLNSNLGYYTNFVNLMDLCAVAVPAGFQAGAVPFGVSLIGPAGAEDELLAIADGLHRALGVGPGVSRHTLPPPAPRPTDAEPPRARLAVVGAHLSGMPLNPQLTDRGATLVRQTKTANCYRLYALPGTTPPKPGMVRVPSGQGVSVELEIWEMSLEAFGSFVAAIPAPLGIGQIQLEDGTSVQGFVCESIALAGARDISSFGGCARS